MLFAPSVDGQNLLQSILGGAGRFPILANTLVATNHWSVYFNVSIGH